MKFLTIVSCVILAASANTQWTVINLHPAWAVSSSAYGVRDGQQVGSAHDGGNAHAGLWSGSGASWVDLHPAGAAGGSEAIGVSAGTQVGHGGVAGSGGACMWFGTAGSWLGLHPAGADFSGIQAADAGQQVGGATFGGQQHAGLWSGTAGSWVDLHPFAFGATRSGAYGVHGGQQAGDATVGGVTRAGLWSGTAASWVDLHPTGSTESRAWGIHSGEQVGWSTVGGIDVASLWKGTAASWVNLHQFGWSASRAFAVHGGQQVGWAAVDFVERASLWSGTAASWVDLSLYIPAGFSSSEARGIWHDGAFTYVVGRGRRPSFRTEALMWVSRSVAPTSYSMVRGSVFAGNLESLLDSDDDRLVMRPGPVLSSGQAPVQLRLNATAPTASPNGFSFSVESSASFSNAELKVWLWNYATGNYELLDTRFPTTTDAAVTVTVRTDPARFIQPGTLAIRALVSFQAVGPSLAFPWSGRVDKVWWNFPG